MKKAQTEIFGVLILLIILIFGVLTFFQLNKKGTDLSYNDKYADPVLAQSYLNVIMKTKTEIGLRVQDIIIECFEDSVYVCKTDAATDCCDYAKKSLTLSLDDTLKEWEKKYTLTVRKEDESSPKFKIANNNGCNAFSSQEQPGVYMLPYEQNIEVILRICG